MEFVQFIGRENVVIEDFEAGFIGYWVFIYQNYIRIEIIIDVRQGEVAGVPTSDIVLQDS